MDTTTHDRPLALHCSRRTTAGRELDTILEAKKEPFPPPEPEPAGTELEGEDNDVSRNVDGTKYVQNTFPVTAIPVRKANTSEPPNQVNRAQGPNNLYMWGNRGQWWELAPV